MTSTSCVGLSGGKLSVGKSSSSTSKGASGSPSPSGGTDTGGAAGTGDAASVAAAYAKFTFESCKDFDCTGRFRKAAGVADTTDRGGYIKRFNPRAKGPNPDPSWLPGWDALPSGNGANDADVVYEALVVAASMKSWQARCHADYAKTHDALVARDTKAKEEIARANAEPNPYTRLAALLSLRPKESVESLAFENALAKIVGARHAIEVAIAEAFRATNREYVYATMTGMAPPEAVVTRGRARGNLEVERDNYCAFAFAQGTSTTPQPTQWTASSYLGRGQKAVKPPVDSARIQQLEAAHKQEYAANAKLFATAVDVSKLSRLENEGHPTKDALLHYVTQTTVKSAKRTGTKLVVELAGHFEHTVPYGCVRTGGLNSAGDPALSCKQRNVVTDRAVTVAFNDVPESITIEPGKRIEFFGKLTASNETKLVDTAQLHKARTTQTYEGLHFVDARK